MGLFGRSMRAASGATLVTTLLGTALAAVYVLAGRQLRHCIAAHFIDALLEPGLVLSVCQGAVGRLGASRVPLQ